MAERKSAHPDAIVLAAGAGVRFGGGKLLAAWEGRPLIASALDAAFAAPVRTVTVAVRALDDPVAEVARRHAEAMGRSGDLRLAVVPDVAEGQAASLRAAIAALPADSAAALVLLGDMPRIPEGIGEALAAAWRRGALACAPSFAGRRGHPVLLDQALFAGLLGLSGDVGARSLLDALGDRLALVPAPDDGVLFDVDRVEDLGPR
jgi:molybdenum cofactor cytidylyltransferase